MNKFSLKYSAIMCSTAVVFLNFVACGAQMYQVSLKEDHDQTKVPAYAKNPDSQYYGLHATDGWHNLPIPFKTGFTLNTEQKKGLKECIDMWETAVGKKLFRYLGPDDKDGDSFADLYSSLSDTTNGHYLDQDWDKTGKSNMVLATTIWDTSSQNHDQILTADIRFNTQHYVIGDAFTIIPDAHDTREVVDMTTLCLHELGHMLGLTHIDKKYDRLSIMNPTIYIGEGLANRNLSCGDIKRIQQIYGCAGEACDQEATCAKFERGLMAEPYGRDDSEDSASRSNSPSSEEI